MKNTVLKWYVTIICLFYNVLIFADPGTPRTLAICKRATIRPSMGQYYFWFWQEFFWQFTLLEGIENWLKKQSNSL
jgi:hypothetical protein